MKKLFIISAVALAFCSCKKDQVVAPTLKQGVILVRVQSIDKDGKIDYSSTEVVNP